MAYHQSTEQQVANMDTKIIAAVNGFRPLSGTDVRLSRPDVLDRYLAARNAQARSKGLEERSLESYRIETKTK